MKLLRIGALVTIGWLGLSPGVVQAAPTADGTLITNVACATYMAPGGQGFAVTYCATQWVLVANPCLALQKLATPTLQSSGGTVTFTLWVVNCSCTNSAFNVQVTDRLPDNMGYVAPSWANWPNGGGTWYQSYGGAAAGPFTAGAAPNGQGAPDYLRYALDMLGVCKSAFVTFQATVL